jgi:TolA-binding protein
MTLLLVVVAVAVSVGGTWLFSQRWHGRQISELQAKIDKHRQTSGNHIAQARKQIAQLQGELTTVQSLKDEVQRLRDREQARVRQTLEELTRDADRDPRPHGQAVSPTGFADTVPVADIEPVPRGRST